MKVALIYDHESELYYTHLYTNAIIQYNLIFFLMEDKAHEGKCALDPEEL